MYDELIKRLRVSCESCKLWDGYKCCLKGECSAQKSLQAADTIEELQLYMDLYKDLTEKGEKIAREVIDKYPKWVPVTVRLPEEIGYYLAHIANINQMSMTTDVVALWDGNHFYVSSFVAVTHWMPLPQPPESEGEI